MLEPWFSSPLLRYQSARQQLLRFYAPHAVEPLGLLRRVIGPESRGHWRSPADGFGGDETNLAQSRPSEVRELVEEWHLCLDISADAHWPEPTRACGAWAMLVRFYQLSPDRLLGDDDHRQRIARKFAEKIARWLPVTLEELSSLAARTPAQEELLARSPELLLPFLPSTRYGAARQLAESEEPRQQLVFLNWLACQGASLEQDLLHKFLQETPRQIEALEPAAQDEIERINRLHGFDASQPLSELQVLHEIDRVAWEAALRDSEFIPWDVIRARLERQSYTLDDQLKAWFARIPDRAPFFSEGPDPVQQRRLALGILLESGKSVSDAVESLAAAQMEPVAGALWASLPPEAPERRALLSAFVDAGTLPDEVPVEELLVTEEHRPAVLERLKLAADHQAALEEAARSAQGVQRYRAICWLACLEEKDKTAALLMALPSADRALREIIVEWALRSGTLDVNLVPDLPSEVLKTAPLPFLAAQDYPGWRDTLIQKLKTGDLEQPGADLGWLVRLARKYVVTAALPYLLRHLGPHVYPAREILSTIAALATDEDKVVAHKALEDALLRGWDGDPTTDWETGEHRPSPWAPLLRFLREEDLEWVVQGRVSALRWEEVRAALLAMGPGIVDRLRQRHRELVEQIGHLRQAHGDAEDTPPSLVAQKPWVELEATATPLAETVVALIDPVQTSTAELARLALEVAGGDIVSVHGSPGALGSDFLEPYDLDWDSTQENKDMVQALERLLRCRLEHHPNEWNALTTLFVHPSASLVKVAFRLAASLAPAHMAPRLALDALEHHVQCSETRLTGDVANFRSIIATGTSGEMGVELPDTASVLIKAMREVLTAAHRPAIEELLQHRLARFRRSAAGWVGDLGSTSWAPLLVPLLADMEPTVVATAVQSLHRLKPDILVQTIQDADRSAWTRDHFQLVLGWLLAPIRHERHSFARVLDPKPRAVTLSEELVLPLLDQAARLEANHAGESRRSYSIFQGLPSIAERYLGPLLDASEPHSTVADRLNQWTKHPAAAVRAVARRLLAERAMLDPRQLQPQLSDAGPEDRFSTLVCLTRMGGGDRPLQLQAAWKSYYHRPQRALTRAELHRYRPVDLTASLFWALQGAPPSFAPLLALVLDQVQTLDGEGITSDTDTWLVRQTEGLMRRWGVLGIKWLVTLMDDGEVDNYCYEFTQLIIQAALSEPAIKTYLEDCAREDGQSSGRLLEEVEAHERAHDQDGFMRYLQDEVFPQRWRV